MSELWTDEEVNALLDAARRLVTTHTLINAMSERALARQLSQQRQFRNRTPAAIYIKIREMRAGGEGWWTKVGRQVQI